MSSLKAFLHTVILLGAVQGFIMAGLLFFSKKKQLANKLLAALILFISLACFNLYGNYIDWFGSPVVRFLADLIPLVIVMPFGPLMYFYMQASLDPYFKITKGRRRQFNLVIIDLVPCLTVLVYFVGFVANQVSDPKPWGWFIDAYNTYADIPRWASITYYLWLSYKYLAAQKIKNNISADNPPADFKWMQQFVRVFLVFQCIWFLYLVPYVIPKYSDALLNAVDWYPIYIPMAIMIYWLGIKGYMVSHAAAPTPKKTAPIQAILSPPAVQQAVTVLEKAMQQDKLYLNPGLNLDMVAEHTGLPQKTISAVLNQHVNTSFNEFVNGYRVEAFKEKVLQPGMENLTIAGVAYECGFNSQATFQRTFKQITGMSPSEFRKSVPETN